MKYFLLSTFLICISFTDIVLAKDCKVDFLKDCEKQNTKKDTCVTRDAVDSYGRSCLHITAHNGNLSFIKKMVEELNFDVNKMDNDKRLPLAHAIVIYSNDDKQNRKEVIKYLAEKTDVNNLAKMEEVCFWLNNSLWSTKDRIEIREIIYGKENIKNCRLLDIDKN